MALEQLQDLYSVNRSILKNVCNIASSAASEIIKYCDADGNVVAFVAPTFAEDGSATTTIYDTNWAILGSLPAGSSVCSSEGFTTSTMVMEDSYPDNPTTLTIQASELVSGGFGASVIKNDYISTVGEGITISHVATYPNEAANTVNANSWLPSSNSIHKMRAEFNRAFTGFLTIISSGTALGSKTVGGFSNNLGKVTNRVNGAIGADGRYAHTVTTDPMNLTFYVEDIQYFTYDVEGGTIITGYSVSLDETKTKFIREITNDGGTYTVNDLNAGDPTTAYTVQGDVAIWEEADTSLPYSDEVIGFDPNPKGGGTIQSLAGLGSFAIAGIPNADNIRTVKITVVEATNVTLTLTLQDGTTIPQEMVGPGDHIVDLPLNFPSIATIDIEEKDNIATRATINYLSKTRF